MDRTLASCRYKTYRLILARQFIVVQLRRTRDRKFAVLDAPSLRRIHRSTALRGQSGRIDRCGRQPTHAARMFGGYIEAALSDVQSAVQTARSPYRPLLHGAESST